MRWYFWLRPFGARPLGIAGLPLQGLALPALLPPVMTPHPFPIQIVALRLQESVLSIVAEISDIKRKITELESFGTELRGYL